MKDKKLQIFVSSTFTDLRQERQAAVEAILSSGNIPAGMELFSAGDENQMTVIERWIDESDVYMLILGGRYGSIEPKSGKSYTHLEYEYALSKNKPLFAVVLSEKALDEKVRIEGRTVIENQNNKELNEFKAIVTSKLVKFCDDSKDIRIAIYQTISEFSHDRKDLVGWIRGDQGVNSGLLAEEIARLTKENSELRIQIATGNAVSNALYNGLSFNELKSLLENDVVNFEGRETNLFEIVVNYGQYFATPRPITRELHELRAQFLMYKLIELINVKSGGGRYVFTQDGHNFYLKAISNNLQEN